VKRRLAVAARRGRLAGFDDRTGPALFSVAAFGDSFDYRLLATAAPANSGCDLTFSLSIVPKAPLIFGLVAVLTVWPGGWLTESMLSTYSTWYAGLPSWVTYAWYMPLTVVPLPWMWRKMHRKSRTAALDHAREQIKKIMTEADGSNPA
jgi:hypothetical protein